MKASEGLKVKKAVMDEEEQDKEKRLHTKKIPPTRREMARVQKMEVWSGM
jgi:hypothetical protein